MAQSQKTRKIEEKIGLLQGVFECPICLDLMKNPVSTKCDHKFCRHCITQTIGHRSSAPCPICKEPFTKRSLQTLKKWRQIVTSVGNLVTAFQKDTGMLFSPPAGVALDLSQSNSSSSPGPSKQSRTEEPLEITSKPTSPVQSKPPNALNEQPPAQVLIEVVPEKPSPALRVRTNTINSTSFHPVYTGKKAQKKSPPAGSCGQPDGKENIQQENQPQHDKTAKSKAKSVKRNSKDVELVRYLENANDEELGGAKKEEECGVDKDENVGLDAGKGRGKGKTARGRSGSRGRGRPRSNSKRAEESVNADNEQIIKPKRISSRRRETTEKDESGVEILEERGRSLRRRSNVDYGENTEKSEASNEDLVVRKVTEKKSEAINEATKVTEAKEENLVTQIQNEEVMRTEKVDGWLQECPDSVSPLGSMQSLKDLMQAERKTKKIFKTTGRGDITKEVETHGAMNDLLSSQDPYKFVASPKLQKPKSKKIEEEAEVALFEEPVVIKKSAGKGERKSRENQSFEDKGLATYGRSQTRSKSRSNEGRQKLNQGQRRSNENPRKSNDGTKQISNEGMKGSSNEGQERLNEGLQIRADTNNQKSPIEETKPEEEEEKDLENTPEEVSSLIERISEAEDFDLLLSQQFRDEEASAKEESGEEKKDEERKYIKKVGNKLIVVENLQPVEDPNLADNSFQLNVVIGEEDGVKMTGDMKEVEMEKRIGNEKSTEANGEDKEKSIEANEVKENSTLANHEDKEKSSEATGEEYHEKQNDEVILIDIPEDNNEKDSAIIDSVTSEISAVHGELDQKSIQFAKKYGRPQKEKLMQKKKRSSNEKLHKFVQDARKLSEVKLLEPSVVTPSKLKTKRPDPEKDWSSAADMTKELVKTKKGKKLKLLEGNKKERKPLHKETGKIKEIQKSSSRIVPQRNESDSDTDPLEMTDVTYEQPDMDIQPEVLKQKLSQQILSQTSRFVKSTGFLPSSSSSGSLATTAPFKLGYGTCPFEVQSSAENDKNLENHRETDCHKQEGLHSQKNATENVSKNVNSGKNKTDLQSKDCHGICKNAVDIDSQATLSLPAEFISATSGASNSNFSPVIVIPDSTTVKPQKRKLSRGKSKLQSSPSSQSPVMIVAETQDTGLGRRRSLQRSSTKRESEVEVIEETCGNDTPASLESESRREGNTEESVSLLVENNKKENVIERERHVDVGEDLKEVDEELESKAVTTEKNEHLIGKDEQKQNARKKESGVEEDQDEDVTEDVDEKRDNYDKVVDRDESMGKRKGRKGRKAQKKISPIKLESYEDEGLNSGIEGQRDEHQDCLEANEIEKVNGEMDSAQQSVQVIAETLESEKNEKCEIEDTKSQSLKDTEVRDLIVIKTEDEKASSKSSMDVNIEDNIAEKKESELCVANAGKPPNDSDEEDKKEPDFFRNLKKELEEETSDDEPIMRGMKRRQNFIIESDSEENEEVDSVKKSQKVDTPPRRRVSKRRAKPIASDSESDDENMKSKAHGKVARKSKNVGKIREKSDSDSSSESDVPRRLSSGRRTARGFARKAGVSVSAASASPMCIPDSVQPVSRTKSIIDNLSADNTENLGSGLKSGMENSAELISDEDIPIKPMENSTHVVSEDEALPDIKPCKKSNRSSLGSPRGSLQPLPRNSGPKKLKIQRNGNMTDSSENNGTKSQLSESLISNSKVSPSLYGTASSRLSPMSKINERNNSKASDSEPQAAVVVQTPKPEATEVITFLDAGSPMPPATKRLMELKGLTPKKNRKSPHKKLTLSPGNKETGQDASTESASMSEIEDFTSMNDIISPVSSGASSHHTLEEEDNEHQEEDLDPLQEHPQVIESDNDDQVPRVNSVHREVIECSDDVEPDDGEDDKKEEDGDVIVLDDDAGKGEKTEDLKDERGNGEVEEVGDDASNYSADEGRGNLTSSSGGSMSEQASQKKEEVMEEMLCLEDQIRNIEAQLVANGTTFDIDTQDLTENDTEMNRTYTERTEMNKSYTDKTEMMDNSRDNGKHDSEQKVEGDKGERNIVYSNSKNKDSEKDEVEESDYEACNSDEDLFASQSAPKESCNDEEATIDTSNIERKVRKSCRGSLLAKMEDAVSISSSLDEPLPSPTPPSVVPDSKHNVEAVKLTDELEKLTEYAAKQKCKGVRKSSIDSSGNSSLSSPRRSGRLQTPHLKRQRSPSKSTSVKKRKSLPSPIRQGSPRTPRKVESPITIEESQSPRRSKRNASPHIASPIKYPKQGIDTQESLVSGKSKASTISPAIMGHVERRQSPRKNAAISRHQNSPSSHSPRKSPRHQNAAISRHQISPSRHSPRHQHSTTTASRDLTPKHSTAESSNTSRHQSPATSRVQSPSTRNSPTINPNGAKESPNVSSDTLIPEVKFEHPPDKWVFTGSGLNKLMHMPYIDKMIKEFGCKFIKKFNKSVTHVLVKPVGSVQCQRTLKYFQAIAHGRYVISIDWIIDSLRRNRLQSMEEYEILGDTAVPGLHGGPRKARQARQDNQPKLMHKYELCCLGDFELLNNGELRDLSEACGAGTVRDPTLFSFDRHAVVLVEKSMVPNMLELPVLKKRYGVDIVHKEWLLDSIGEYTVKNLEDYNAFSKTG